MSAAAVKLSWADIVKGSMDTRPTVFSTLPVTPEIQAVHPPAIETDELIPVAHEFPAALPEVLETLPSLPVVPDIATARRPGSRGGWQCWCRGELLVMLGHYGWISALDEIDHPDVSKNGGRIYVHSRDLVGRRSPKEGEIVGFYLYADNQGLGAEACCFEQSEKVNLMGEVFDASADVPNFSQTSDHSVPSCKRSAQGLNTSADEFFPARAVCHPSMNVGAAEFVPGFGASMYSQCQLNGDFPQSMSHQHGHGTQISPFQVMSTAMINPAYLSDDSDSEDECGNTAGQETSDDESGRSSDASRDVRLDRDLKVTFHAPTKSIQSPYSPADSTCVDSENEIETETDSEVSVESISMFRAPPGLSLPRGVSPPPGLCFPPGLDNYPKRSSYA